MQTHINYCYMLHIEGKTLHKCDISTTGHVVIPDGIECIQTNAFKDCSLVAEITIPYSVKELGRSSIFEGCSSLKQIILPSSITEVPPHCFERCTSLEIVKLPENCTSISDEAFKDCSNLKEIILPTKIFYLGNSTFEGCISLKKINISESLNYINSRVFKGCKSLEEIVIPKTISRISLEAFFGCTSLVKVCIRNRHIEISPTAFVGCTLLHQVTITGTNPFYALTAFADCSNLKHIVLEEDNRRTPIIIDELRRNHSQELKYMSMYYRQFGMNITQMKWAESLKNEKSFKEPIDIHWKDYKYHEQSLSYLLDMNWDNSEGIGLTLGYNGYRALDIDNVSLFHLKCEYGEDAFNHYINLYLEKLGLPSDYPWTIISGSGNGFHIIFKADDLNENIDSISYSPNDKHNAEFTRIELRWCDHLILPPSLHKSSNRYRFRDDLIPSTPPCELELSKIDNLIEFFCSQILTKKCKCNGHSIELAENLKIHQRHDSYLSPHERNEDSIEWLKKSNTDENRNSLAVRYLLAKNIEFDSYKAKKLLESSNTQTSIFNLLNLYACGLCACDFNEFQDKFTRLDKKIFSEESIQLIELNANKNIQHEETYLFLDTETTGLPHDSNAPITDVNNWPRIIQISWILATESQKIICEKNYIIKPEGFKVPEGFTTIHGITNEFALQKGVNIEFVLNDLLRDLKKVDYIVGHNIKYDVNVVSAELIRKSYKKNILGIPQICTMLSSVIFCKIPNFWGSYKYPRLQQLYFKLFNKVFDGAHNSLTDAKAAFDCFYELKNRGIIVVKRDYNPPF